MRASSSIALREREEMRVTEVTPFGKSDDETEAGGAGEGGMVEVRRQSHTERKVSKACLFQVIASPSFVFRICQKKSPAATR